MLSTKSWWPSFGKVVGATQKIKHLSHPNKPTLFPATQFELNFMLPCWTCWSNCFWAARHQTFWIKFWWASFEKLLVPNKQIRHLSHSNKPTLFSAIQFELNFMLPCWTCWYNCFWAAKHQTFWNKFWWASFEKLLGPITEVKHLNGSNNQFNFEPIHTKLNSIKLWSSFHGRYMGPSEHVGFWV